MQISFQLSWDPDQPPQPTGPIDLITLGVGAAAVAYMLVSCVALSVRWSSWSCVKAKNVPMVCLMLAFSVVHIVSTLVLNAHVTATRSLLVGACGAWVLWAQLVFGVAAWCGTVAARIMTYGMGFQVLWAGTSRGQQRLVRWSCFGVYTGVALVLAAVMDAGRGVAWNPATHDCRVSAPGKAMMVGLVTVYITSLLLLVRTMRNGLDNRMVRERAPLTSICWVGAVCLLVTSFISGLGLGVYETGRCVFSLAVIAFQVYTHVRLTGRVTLAVLRNETLYELMHSNSIGVFNTTQSGVISSPTQLAGDPATMQAFLDYAAAQATPDDTVVHFGGTDASGAPAVRSVDVSGTSATLVSLLRAIQQRKLRITVGGLDASGADAAATAIIEAHVLKGCAAPAHAPSGTQASLLRQPQGRRGATDYLDPLADWALAELWRRHWARWQTDPAGRSHWLESHQLMVQQLEYAAAHDLVAADATSRAICAADAANARRVTVRDDLGVRVVRVDSSGREMPSDDEDEPPGLYTLGRPPPDEHA